ncbi:hypothetical protein [Bremerella alba]|uniref:Carboxypeptidase regulatory-like domain-containing protein n=1 Tax=Bremerella alba TaxID=980252 RepID=A0A7V9A870_9BACT|nr:hypothetical protein [Bremerella alba]MBA2116180.1 hypothetical protein [Bremerella alba]
MVTFIRIVFATSVLCFLGCSEQTGPQRLTAKGKVFLDDSPVTNATIIFSPQGGGEGSVKAAASIVDGSFSFTPKDGPTAGAFDVQIIADGAEFEDVADKMISGQRVAIKKAQIPKVYSSPGSLTANVTKDGPNDFNFELESKRRRR